jgi:hypothetical protein
MHHVCGHSEEGQGSSEAGRMRASCREGREKTDKKGIRGAQRMGTSMVLSECNTATLATLVNNPDGRWSRTNSSKTSGGANNLIVLEVERAFQATSKPHHSACQSLNAW